jgi:serine/threonine protein kinase, bacterial
MTDFGLLQAGLEPYPGYRLTRALGRGGFGEVWEARNACGRPLALKFLPCDAEQTAAREIRSLQAIRQLQHPHLIRIERVWCYRSYIVIAMERADGSLADLVDTYQLRFGTPVVPEHACLLLSDAANALDFLNKRQHAIEGRIVSIQHCDIKPKNLLLFGDTVKLADFGLSSSLGSRLESRFRAGTLGYCAPEVLQGKLSDHSDQYALAVTYCALRGGRLPFDDPKSFRSGRTPPPSFYTRPTMDLTVLSEAERPIVSRALHAVPQNRWPSCRELMTRLTRVVCEEAAGREAAKMARGSGARRR